MKWRLDGLASDSLDISVRAAGGQDLDTVSQDGLGEGEPAAVRRQGEGDEAVLEVVGGQGHLEEHLVAVGLGLDITDIELETYIREILTANQQEGGHCQQPEFEIKEWE